MNLDRLACSVVLGSIALGLCTWATPLGAAGQASQQRGEVVNGLKMSVYPNLESREAARVPRFEVELRNVGDKDLLLLLGDMLVNGKKQYPNAVRVLLTDEQGESLDCGDPEPDFVAGWAGPLIVPLSAGASYTIPVDLGRWTADWKWCYTPRRPGPLTLGKYTLRMPYTASPEIGQDHLPGPNAPRPRTFQPDEIFWAGVILMPKWLGTVTSNQVSFEVPAK